MKPLRLIFFGLVWAGLLLIWVLPSAAQESKTRHGIPEGVFVNITKDFYRELEKPEAGERVYGTNRSDEYLRQISVSTKYMVETNLRIINQQEKIIELLEAIKKKR
jgi:hypothetical protein